MFGELEGLKGLAHSRWPDMETIVADVHKLCILRSFQKSSQLSRSLLAYLFCTGHCAEYCLVKTLRYYRPHFLEEEKQ